MNKNFIQSIKIALMIVILMALAQAPFNSMGTAGVAHANSADIDALVINGPPHPPAAFADQRIAVTVPKTNQPNAVVALNVPAYNWVFGCSSVSAAMIAAYYDRNGFPQIYQGPTNGGVMPLDSSVWPTWSDGAATYPNNPLIASHNGLDGRVTRGSLDDYWVQYGSTAPDPYLTNGWTQHAWGTAIGDYMKTSQSAYNNTDGSTNFYNYVSVGDALTCANMVGVGISTLDGTYGRKLFYEARGYTVTDCYSQKTDNNAGGFTFARYKAEIDAGNPVLLNLSGHSIVGLGYDASSSTVYLHDTWDYNTYTMPWGGSYAGMQLLSVSIVHISDPPGAFNKSAPASGATGLSASPTLSWAASSGAVSYDYCYDTTNDNVCAGWVNNGLNTSVSLSGLSNGSTYYWQVRANNAGGVTYANASASAFWSFTTAGNPVPALTSLSPTSAMLGAATFTLTVNGSNFINSSVVRWNGADRPTTYVSAYQLNALIAGTDLYYTGTFPVTVFNPTPGGGTSNAANFSVVNPVPQLSSLNPSGSVAGDPAFTLTVNGSNFVPGSVLRWNGSDRPTTFVSINKLSAAIPAADIATLNIVSVVVFNPAPGGGTSTSYNYKVLNPVPMINVGLSPSSASAGGPAFTLTVKGASFVRGSVVRWNGSNRPTTYVSATELSAAITAADIASMGTIPVTVLNYNTPLGDGISNAVNFTVNAANGVVLAVLNPSTVFTRQNFDLVIEVRAGSQPVDGAAAYLNFNPGYLKVVSITPGASLPSVLQNSYDNTAGTVNFAAAALSTFPSGTFTLATITFTAQAPVSSTALAFNTSAPRKSDVTYGGNSVLTDHQDGTVKSEYRNKVYVPVFRTEIE